MMPMTTKAVFNGLSHRIEAAEAAQSPRARVHRAKAAVLMKWGSRAREVCGLEQGELPSIRFAQAGHAQTQQPQCPRHELFPA